MVQSRVLHELAHSGLRDSHVDRRGRLTHVTERCTLVQALWGLFVGAHIILYEYGSC